MSRGKKKGEASVFILFTPKQSKIKNLKEIKKHVSGVPSNTFANTQILNNNCPQFLSKASPLNQIFNTNDDNMSNIKSIAGSEAGFDFEKARAKLFYLAIDIDQDQLW